MTGRITLVISSLRPGGAERVLSSMANYWAEEGQEVSLVTLASEVKDSGSEQDHYRLHPKVIRSSADIYADAENFIQRLVNQVTRIRRLRRAILATSPAIVISFVDTTNVRVLLSTIGTGLPVIVSERSVPTRWPIGRAWALLRRLSYRRAAAVVVQTQGVRQWVGRFVSNDKVTVIPNSVETRSGNAHEKENVVVAMGRLSHEKGFDLLLKTWAQVSIQNSDWRLLIIGDGPKRHELEQSAEHLGIKECVRFAGIVAEPHLLMQNARVFVLSSRFEGFPNALLEAMSLGIPAVSFNCEYGPAEIIRDGIDGRLVQADNWQALAGDLADLMNDEVLRNRLGERAREVSHRFAPDRVMQAWSTLVQQLQHR